MTAPSHAHVGETVRPERLMAFTDAVVAIAQTLLILPLLESVPEAQAHHLSSSAWLHENSMGLELFGLSFVLIWMIWDNHHRIFEHVESLSLRLKTLNMFWMLGIVFLPIATALMGLGHSDHVQLGIYIGSLLFCSVIMTLMGFEVSRNPAIIGERPPLSQHSLAGLLAVNAMYVLALVLALSVPGLGYWAMLCMFLQSTVSAFISRFLPAS